MSGPHLAYWVNAVTFGLSAVFVAGIPARLLQSERSIGRGHWTELREGFQTVRQSRPLYAVLIVWSIAMVAVASANLAEIFIAKRTLHGGDFGFGLIVSAIGVGLVIGALSANRVVRRLGLSVAYSLRSALGVSGWPRSRPPRTSGLPRRRWWLRPRATAWRSSSTSPSSSAVLPTAFGGGRWRRS